MIPALKAPDRSTDCHIHIYGPRDRYPLAPTCPAEPPFAAVDAYRQVQSRLGLERVVVVQPAAYGKDNRCTVDAVAQFGADARGVVVVDRDVSEDELADYTSKGARGARFFLLKGGAVSIDDLHLVASRIKDFGWHIQLQVDGRTLPDLEATLRALPVPLVIDHTGKFLDPVTPDHPAFKALAALVGTGRVWVKLSAPYETSKLGPPAYEDVGRLARRLIAIAPDRMLWATNWPHPTAQHNLPDDAGLLDTLLLWCNDAAVRERILVTNPADLYGFRP